MNRWGFYDIAEVALLSNPDAGRGDDPAEFLLLVNGRGAPVLMDPPRSILRFKR